MTGPTHTEGTIGSSRHWWVTRIQTARSIRRQRFCALKQHMASKRP